MLAQDGADFVEVDFAFADLQAFAIKTFGVAEVEMGGMGTELRQSFREIEGACGGVTSRSPERSGT